MPDIKTQSPESSKELISTGDLVRNEFVTVTVTYHQINSDQLESLQHGVKESTFCYSVAFFLLGLAADKAFDAYAISKDDPSDSTQLWIFLAAVIGVASFLYGLIKSRARKRVIETIKARGTV